MRFKFIILGIVIGRFFLFYRFGFFSGFLFNRVIGYLFLGILGRGCGF